MSSSHPLCSLPRRSRLLVPSLALLLLPQFARIGAAAPDYTQVAPLVLADRLADVLADPATATPDYWRDKPQLKETYLYSLRSTLGPQANEAVRKLKQGQFSPYPAFAWRPLGVPPPWDSNPENSRTWEHYTHELSWVGDLVRAHISQPSDLESLRLAQSTFNDWISKNSRPPHASIFMWRDSTVGNRLRVMCWFWEVWRQSKAFDPKFAKVFLASVYQHAAYLSDPKEYLPKSNHGLDMDAGLLAASVTFPEFKDAPQWRALAEIRLADYIQNNTSPEGFHLEQSPSYHWLVVTRIAAVLGFLRANGQTAPVPLLEGFHRTVSVWPYLLRSDTTVPLIGDSATVPTPNWRHQLAQSARGLLPPAAPPTLPNPRQDSSHFLLSFPAGYAIFTADDPGKEKPSPDTHALLKCNSFRFTHSHVDALSFTFYGLGRDWIVDTGKYNYEEKTPERRYVRSARAHNTVLVDDRDFQYCPIALLDYGRNAIGDWVAARHQLPQATHTRTFEFVPPTSAWLTDTLESTDGKPHTYTQLFHVAPGLKVEQVGPSRMQLTAPNGDLCLLDQLAPVGEWRIITGQKDPVWQGWYSPDFNKIEPIPTLCFTSVQPSKALTFVTRVSLIQGGTQGTSSPPTAPAPRPQPAPPAAHAPLPRALPGAAPQAASAPASPVTVFSDPLDQYRSQWNYRTRVAFARAGEGIRCSIAGGADKSGGQYGGLRFPAASPKALRLTLSFLQPKNIKMLYVDGYDAQGRRLLRWTWDATKTRLPSKPQTFTLSPGKRSSNFRPEGPGLPAGVTEVDVFALVLPGSTTGFVLHRAEVVP